jgi:hypothetical protein
MTAASCCTGVLHTTHVESICCKAATLRHPLVDDTAPCCSKHKQVVVSVLYADILPSLLACLGTSSCTVADGLLTTSPCPLQTNQKQQHCVHDEQIRQHNKRSVATPSQTDAMLTSS